MAVHLLLILLAAPGIVWGKTDYFGKKLGPFKTYFHEVKGDVYAVDEKTIHIRSFSYDGAGPDAFFWAGSSDKPDKSGFIVPDERGTKDVLQPYSRKHITLTLPNGKTLKDIKWISVWCRKFTVNFGDIMIPNGLDYPKPQKLEPLRGVEHDTSADTIMVVDAQTFLVPNFTTDGLAPDAHFWIGQGNEPTADGTQVPDENGSDKPLGRYDKKTLVISLPGEWTVHDIDYFGVWCKLAAVSFGHVNIPKNLNVPPSPRMLGQSVQSKLNCEFLTANPHFEVRWVVAGNSIIMQLVARLPEGHYMSFGLSGDQEQSIMNGADVVVAWIDKALQGHAVDYFLESKAQCSGGSGSCPDDRIVANSSHVNMLTSSIADGYSMVTIQRLLNTGDPLDIPILRGSSQAVVWAIGPLNSLNEVSYHASNRIPDTLKLQFDREPQWNCKPPTPVVPTAASRSSSIPNTTPYEMETTTEIPTTTLPPAVRVSPSTIAATTFSAHPALPTPEPWFIPPIQCHEPEDGVFFAQIGPTGGQQGYTAITGNVGWGIAWYINGLLIPELTVVRGKTYRFFIEGGNDPQTPSRNHPFYITDDPEGGYEHKTPEEREKIRVFAGVSLTPNGPMATGMGRLCEWKHSVFRSPDEYNSFGEYQRDLKLHCGRGSAGILTWTPDENTPDTVYYQCYNHRYLGWKISVVDECPQEPAFSESIRHEVNVTAPHLQALSKDIPKVTKQESSNEKAVPIPKGSSAIPFPPTMLQHPHGVPMQQFRGYPQMLPARGYGMMPAQMVAVGMYPMPGFYHPRMQMTPQMFRPPRFENPKVSLLPKQDLVNGSARLQKETIKPAVTNQTGASSGTFPSPPPPPPPPPPTKLHLHSGFQPIRSDVQEPDLITSSPYAVREINTTFVADPFHANNSVPFHSSFRPGVPRFGGFNASTYRSPGVKPVDLPRRVVPQQEIDPMVAAASEPQNTVLFRAPNQGVIPPLPPNLGSSVQLPPGSPPNVKRTGSTQPISYDGSPVTNNQFSPVRPGQPTESKPTFRLQHTRPFGPYKGQKPPPIPEDVPSLPQLQGHVSNIKTRSSIEADRRQDLQASGSSPEASKADFDILKNVWSIMATHGEDTVSRTKRESEFETKVKEVVDEVADSTHKTAEEKQETITEAPNSSNGACTTSFFVILITLLGFIYL